MLPLVALTVLASAAMHAGWNAVLKGRPGTDPATAAAALALSWSLMGAAGVCLVAAPAAGAYPYLAASVGIHVVYFWALSSGYSGGDMGLVYPIARGLPPALIALFGAVVLEEPLSLRAAAGVCCITLGVVSIGVSGRAGVDRRSIGWGVTVAVLIAIYSVVDGLGVRASNAVSYATYLIALEGAAYFLTAAALRGRRVWGAIRPFLGRGMVGGVLSAGAYAIVLWAMTRAPLALVSALRETSILFGVVFAALFLGEPLTRRRWVAAAIITLGAGLVVSHE